MLRHLTDKPASLLIVLAALTLVLLAGCDTAASGVTGTTKGKPILAAAQVTAVAGAGPALPAPADVTALDLVAGRQMLAQLFPSPFTPVEQTVYTTRQSLDTVKQFYEQQLAAAGYTPEVTWSDLSRDSQGASWAKQNVQVRVILTTDLLDTDAQQLNTTFKLAATPLKSGDNLIYIISVDRSRVLP